MILVRIKQDVSKMAPDWERPRELKTGQLVQVQGYIDSPRGMIKKWAFWSDYDVDGALILQQEDVSEILVTETDERLHLLDNVPLPITLLPDGTPRADLV